MAMRTSYATLDGEIVSVSIDGVRKDLIPDPLGSVAALVDSTGTITDTFTYWPYGEERTRTGTTEISTKFVGAWGYYWDNPKRDYVRARYLEKNLTRWLTVDPLWPSEAAYGYVLTCPTRSADPSGLQTYYIPENLCLALVERPVDQKQLVDCLARCRGKGKKELKKCAASCLDKYGPVDKSKSDLYLACLITHQENQYGWTLNPCKTHPGSSACCSMYFYECLFKRERENKRGLQTWCRIADALMPGRVILECHDEAVNGEGCGDDTFVAPPIDRDWIKA